MNKSARELEIGDTVEVISKNFGDYCRVGKIISKRLPYYRLEGLYVSHMSNELRLIGNCPRYLLK